MRIRPPALVLMAVLAVSIGGLVATGRGSAQQQTPADLLVLNGKVYRGAGSTAFGEAVAVRGNRIAEVGSSADLSRLRGPNTVVIDATGRAVVPGFNDVHTHLLNGGLEMENVNLQGAGTLTEVQSRIQTFAREHADRPWIRGRGWGYGAFPGNMPTKQLLDAVVSDRPAVMRCFDGHSVWVNSKALAAAGITRNTPDPPRGVIVRDSAGEPTGLLKETPAMDLVNRVIPPPTTAEQRRAIERASEEALRYGVTSITEAAGNPNDFAMYDQVRRDGTLKLRVYYSMLVNPGLTDADADMLDAVWKQHPDNEWLKTGLIKMFMDGVIETNTAFMLEPYANIPITGTPNYTPQEFSRMVRMLDRRGWQIMVHGLGDGAVREVLDGFADVAKANPMPVRGRRHRVEHIETINPADIPRFGALGVIASMHPGGGFTPPPSPTPRPGGRGAGGLGGVWAANIGPERAARGGMWKSIRDAGGHVVFGSDWAVASLDAFSRITSIVNRPPRPGGTDQRLTFQQAIDGYTSEAAYASFDETRKGTLEPGKLADIVVLGSDVFAEPPTTREAAAVYATIVDGKIAYRKN